MRPLTNEEYLASDAICPFCRSNDIEQAGNQEQGDRKIYHPHHCLDCGCEWDEVYTLTHYQGVQGC